MDTSTFSCQFKSSHPDENKLIGSNPEWNKREERKKERKNGKKQKI